MPRKKSRPRPRPKKTLVAFLREFAANCGPESLEGAILLLRLDRPIDDLVSRALGLGPYHPGTPSRWSHNVLVAAPFKGKDPKRIPIFDCTIRDKNDKIAWKTDLCELLEKPPTKQGGIYSGRIGDYADSRVHDYGIKYIKGLSPAERRKIVAKGKALQARPYYYDIPGLFRKLVYFLFKLTLPAKSGLLYCSAFCQKAYVEALGPDAQFQKKIRTVDTTDDDIWYSSVGDCYPLAAAARGRRRPHL